MERALILAALICVCGVLSTTEARWTVRPKRTTTTIKPTTMAMASVNNNNNLGKLPIDEAKDDETKHEFYHPAAVREPRLIEEYDQRSIDGHYEYRYVLSNGDTRYERAYWLPVGDKKILARKGYYSYPTPNHKFVTVFYTADHEGFHQDSSSLSQTAPLLPRSLDVPQYDPPKMTTTTERPHKKINPMRKRKTTTTTKSSATDTHDKDMNMMRNELRVVEAYDKQVILNAILATEAITTTRRTPPTTATITTEGQAAKVEKQKHNLHVNMKQLQMNQHAKDIETAIAVDSEHELTLPTTAQVPKTTTKEGSAQNGTENDIYTTVTPKAEISTVNED